MRNGINSCHSIVSLVPTIRLAPRPRHVIELAISCLHQSTPTTTSSISFYYIVSWLIPFLLYRYRLPTVSFNWTPDLSRSSAARWRPSSTSGKSIRSWHSFQSWPDLRMEPEEAPRRGSPSERNWLKISRLIRFVNNSRKNPILAFALMRESF